MKTWKMMRPWLLRGKQIENKKSEESPEKTKKGLNEDEEHCLSYLKKGRCHFGLTGRQEHDGKAECPFNHPRTCEALLNHGNKGNQGCKEKTSGYRKFHTKL